MIKVFTITTNLKGKKLSSKYLWIYRRTQQLWFIFVIIEKLEHFFAVKGLFLMLQSKLGLLNIDERAVAFVWIFFIARKNFFYWTYFLYFKVPLLDYILWSWNHFANQHLHSRIYQTLPFITICCIYQGFSITRTEGMCSLIQYFNSQWSRSHDLS